MARHRFFLQEPLPDSADGAPVCVPLTGTDRHHLSVVLRARPGEEIVGVEPDGAAAVLRLVSVGAESVSVTRVEQLAPALEPRVTLVLGVSKGAKVDEVVEGAVEVGVAQIAPVLCARSIVRLDAEKRAERGARWRRVALAAAKQAQRAFVPAVSDPVALPEALQLLGEHDLVLVAWEEADGQGLRAAIAAADLAPGAHVALVVGPEGGLTPEEVAALGDLGAVQVTLGPTILRTETAGVVASALLVHELGGLGNTCGA